MNEDMEYNYESYTPQPEVTPEEKPRKKRGGAALVAVALCCSLLGSALGAGGVLALQSLTEDSGDHTTIVKGEREPVQIQIMEVDSETLMTPAQVYAANVNSTVGITTSVTTNFWGYSTTSAASGSGFIISDDGYILTNHHVIADSSSITVSMYDGSSYEAVLVGCDESNDIAVLKIEAENLVPVVLGDSDSLNVGDSVVAIGNPLGELTFSLTTGAVSAKDREVTFSGNVTMDLIQTDCAINSGNSGGALFNLYGEVIGITNAKYSSGFGETSIDNIGFAIPVNEILPIVESIIEKGYVSKPYIGVSIYDVSAEAQAFGVPAGAAVQAVSADSPAEAAGLQAGDVITACNGEAVCGSDDLVELVGACQVGDTLTLAVYRQGETLELTLTVAEQISSAQGGEQAQSGSLQPMTPGFGMPGR